MSTDTKQYGKRRRKRKFHGNQHSKKPANETKNILTPLFSNGNIESETDESVDTDVTSLKTATPTTSERKLHNLYSLPQ